MKIYLVRHGQTDANISGIYQGNMDVPLNDTGVKQAYLLGERLKNQPIDVIYSSHLKRARSTAQAIVEHHDLNPIIKKDFQEISLGEWQGKSRETVQEEYKDFLEARKANNDVYNTPAPGGESFKELEVRSMRQLHEVIANEDKEHVMIVSHGGVIKSIIANILELSFEKHRTIDVYNTSITTLKYDKAKQRFKIINMNDVTHLDTMQKI